MPASPTLPSSSQRPAPPPPPPPPAGGAHAKPVSSVSPDHRHPLARPVIPPAREMKPVTVFNSARSVMKTVPIVYIADRLCEGSGLAGDRPQTVVCCWRPDRVPPHASGPVGCACPVGSPPAPARGGGAGRLRCGGCFLVRGCTGALRGLACAAGRRWDLDGVAPGWGVTGWWSIQWSGCGHRWGLVRDFGFGTQPPRYTILRDHGNA